MYQPAKWDGPVLPASISYVLFACDPVVTNTAEPTNQLETDLAEIHFF